MFEGGKRAADSPLQRYISTKVDEATAESVNGILHTTLQLIMCSQIFKKVKIALAEQYIEDESVVETELVQEMLRFVLIVLRKSHTRYKCIYI